MISIVLYAMIAIGLASAAGYAVISFYDAARVTMLANENTARLEQITSYLEQNLRPAKLDGVLYPPMGVNGVNDDYTRLPDWLGAQVKTPWGVPYSYCPLAPDTAYTGSGATGVVTMADTTTTYNVDLTSGNHTGGHDYVTGSGDSMLDASLQGLGVLAMVISPMPNGTTVPNCDAVIFDNGAYTVADGVVRVISRGFAAAQQLAAASSKAVIYVDDTAASGGSGASQGDPMPIEAALASWDTNRPRVYEIHLATGTYSIATADEGAFSPTDTGNPEGATIIFRGAGSGTTSIVATDGTMEIAIPARLHIEDLKLGQGTTLRIPGPYDARLTDSAFYQVTVEGGEMTMDGTNVVTDSTALGDAGIDVTAGNLNLRDTINVSDYDVGVRLGAGARLDMRDSATLSVDDAPTSAIETAGEVMIIDSDVQIPSGASYGIRLFNGSRLHLEQVSLGTSANRATIGIMDEGVLSISGQGSPESQVWVLASGGDCWNGDMFDMSDPGDLDGDSSSPQTPLPVVAKPSAGNPPTQGDVDLVADYAEYSAELAVYRSLRAVNRSIWTCNR